MADNDRVQWDIDDLYYGQTAQVGRTNFTPGKASNDAGGMNWEQDFRIPVGVLALESSGPLEVTRVRTSLTRRNVISNQTILDPVAEVNPGSNLTTATQDVDGTQERTAGYDWAEGA